MRRTYAEKLPREAGLLQSRRRASSALRKAGSSSGTVAARILSLQRLAGNAAVAELLIKTDKSGRSGTIDLIEGEPLEKNLCENPAAADRSTQAPSAGDRALPEDGRQLAVRAQLSLETASSPEGDGRRKRDAVKENLGVGNKVTHGGANLGDDMFGAEQAAYQAKDTDFKETKSAAGDVVEIASTMFLDIHWGTQSLGRKDVTSPTSALVKKHTYSDIVSDLTPNDTGRPLRTKYWASDLTSKHEQFHASDDIAQAQLYLPTLKAWMNTKTVSPTKPAVAALVDQARGKIEADGWAHYHDGGEDRAYADGKTSYQDRADKISARAAKEGWE